MSIISLFSNLREYVTAVEGINYTETVLPEFTKTPKKGNTVRWKYGTGTGEGKVIKVYKTSVTRKLGDSEITRNGTEDNPALLIEQDGAEVLKLASEVTIVKKDADFSELFNLSLFPEFSAKTQKKCTPGKSDEPTLFKELMQSRIDLLDFSEYFEIILLPEFASTGAKPKKCTKGFACGGTCLPIKSKSGKDTRCKNKVEGQAASFTSFLAVIKKTNLTSRAKAESETLNSPKVERDEDGFRVRTSSTGKKLDSKKLLKDKIGKLNKEIQKTIKSHGKAKGEEKTTLTRKLKSQQTALLKLVNISRELEDSKKKIRFDTSDLKALGLKGTPSEEDVVKAYRAMSLKYHPDVNINKSKPEQEKASQAFREATEAYKRMKDKYAK